MITQEQAFKVIGILKTEYRESYRGYTQAEIERKAALYQVMFRDYSYEQVQAALYAYMAEGHKYEPKTGELIQRIKKYSNSEEDEREALAAWAVVRKMISRASTVTRKEFDTLPDVTRKAIGDVFVLKCWGMETGVEAVDTVIASQFISAYKATVSAERARQVVPRTALEVLQHSAEPERLEERAVDSTIKPCISDDRAAGEPAGTEGLRKPEEHRSSYTDTEEYQRRRAALYRRLTKQGANVE